MPSHVAVLRTHPVYHDRLCYPSVGRARIRGFAATDWGRLFERC